MRIVIDISQDRYDEIMSMDWKNCRRIYDEEIRAIHDGKVLEYEPTREEKALLQKWRDNRGISIEEFGKALDELQKPKADKALNLLAERAIECGFGYDNIPEQYEKYKDEIADMGYAEGLAYIAQMESEVKL